MIFGLAMLAAGAAAIRTQSSVAIETESEATIMTKS